MRRSEELRTSTVKKEKAFNYIAIGDSLTEGIGDTTGQGGFVPLVAQGLKTNYRYTVKSSNYGVSGNTSQQILTRIDKKKDIQKSLKKADMMTLTVGGNDVMTVIRKKLSNLKVSSFKKPARTYQKNLEEIISSARSQNKNLPIYILGIYNPYYLNFPDLTQMQDVIDNWNKGSQEIAEKYDNVYFVPINDLLYKGVDGQGKAVEAPSSANSSGTVENNALYDGDHFHPNNIGYQIMSKAVMEKISETKKNWK